MASSSLVPLATKLGIHDDVTVALIDVDVAGLELPPTVRVRTSTRARADVVVACFTSAARLRRRLDALIAMIGSSGALWLAWPKKSSGVTTDLTDGVVRDLVLIRGLVDNKVCALDDTWTALRFVWRRENR